MRGSGKMSLRNIILSATLIALMAGCASQPRQAAPPPVPAPVRPQPSPPPPPVAPSLGWQDLPMSQGSWSLHLAGNGTEAVFGSGSPGFIIRCDLQGRQVRLLRPGVTTGNVMTLRTTEAQKSLPIAITQDGSATPHVVLSAQDPMLDHIAFSRGRFSVEVPGMPMLMMPPWPELARVIDDCRS